MSANSYCFASGGRNSVSDPSPHQLPASPESYTILYRDTEGATVMLPAEIGEDLGGIYDWGLKTTEQDFLGGRMVTLNQGRAVGGGTILNGMVWTRGSSKDYDAWNELNGGQTQTSRYGWGWSDLLPYFQKVRSQNPWILTCGRCANFTGEAERELFRRRRQRVA